MCFVVFCFLMHLQLHIFDSGSYPMYAGTNVNSSGLIPQLQIQRMTLFVEINTIPSFQSRILTSGILAALISFSIYDH